MGHEGNLVMRKNASTEAGKKRSPEAIRLRKQSVLAAAAREFASKGYADADMDRIAESARVGKGTIYRYYTSKEQLFEAVADEAIDRLWEFLFSAIQAVDDDDPVEQLKAGGKAFFAFFDGNHGLLEVFLRGGSQFRERLRDKYFQTYADNVHIIQGLIDRCIGDGILKKMDSRMLADTAGDMLIGLVYMWGARRERRSLAEQWPFVEEIILEGILVR